MAQKFFSLVPEGTNIAFVKNRWRYIIISLLAVAIGLGAMVWRHVETGSFLNFGIDFAGGSTVRLAIDPEEDPGIDAIRGALDEHGYEGSSAVLVPDKAHQVLIRVKEVVSIDEAQIERCEQAVQTVPAATAAEAEHAKLLKFNHPEGGSKLFLTFDAEPSYPAVQELVNEAGCEGTADKGFGAKQGEFAVDFALIGMGSKIQADLDETFGEGTVDHIVRSETVGAKVGGQLKTDGAMAMLYAVSFIFLYVMIRFDLRFAPGGIVALAHDAFLVVAAFAITGKEFTLQAVAAVLTVIGYSINDTIVVFDRVRERVALYRDDPLELTTNNALNDTLSRTILTSGTTLLVVLATYFLGTGPIKDFSFALIVGVMVGTYSSLYIASPIFLWVNKRFYKGQGHLTWLDDKKEGTGTLLGGDKMTGAQPPETEEAAGGEDEPVVPGRKRTRRRRRQQRPAPSDGDES